MGKTWVTGLIVIAFFCSIPAFAENLLVNPSFEDPVAANNTSTYTLPTGWNYAWRGGATAFYIYRPVPTGTYPPAEGAQRFVVTNKTLITQQTEAIEANTVYTFKIQVVPYAYNANDEGGRISLRVFKGSSYVILAESEDYRSVNYRTWGTVTVQWDSTDYPQFWGMPLTVAMNVTAASTMFFDNAFLEKAPSTKKICITRDIPTAFIAVSENGAAYDFDVQLLQVPTSNVSVTIDPNDSQLDVGAGPGAPVALTFTSSDWNTPQTVTVSAVDNAIAEDIALTPILFSVASSDPAYSTSDPNNPVPDPLLVKVVDNDTAKGQLLYNGGFELPNIETEAKSYYQVSDGWAELLSFAQGYRYNPPASSSIQPTEGDTRIAILMGTNMIQPVGSFIEADTGYVFAVDRYASLSTVDCSIQIACYDALDLLDPANLVVLSESRYLPATTGAWERYYVSWDSLSAPQYVGKKLAVIITSGLDNVIMDNATLNETYILLTETEGTNVVSERASLGNTYTYSIALMRQPASDVTITVAPDGNPEGIDLGAGVGVPVSMTFNSSNWNTPQFITVTAIDDAVNEGETPKTYMITHSAAGSDPYFSGAYVKDVKITVNDDDYPAVLLEDAELEVSEAETTSDVYGIYLQIAPTSDVTISLTADEDVTVNPAQLVFTTDNWATPQTVTVTAVDDKLTQGNPHTAVITHTISSDDTAYASVAAVKLNVAVIENDFCGEWGFHPGDLNQDCYINLEDFEILALNWLSCSNPGDPDCTTALIGE